MRIGAVRRLQWAFDKGASAEQLQKLSRELNLEFNKGDIKELLAAIKYRDAGGRGTRFVERFLTGSERSQGTETVFVLPSRRK